jgi:hypothetical protein
MLVLKAVQPTFLKRDPTKQAAELPPEAKYFLAVGAAIEITAFVLAANQHLQVTLKQPLNGFVTWFAFSSHVQVVEQTTDLLEVARDRQKVFNSFLAMEVQQGANQDRLVFLDRGLSGSFIETQIAAYPDRLRQAPDGRTVVSLGDKLQLAGSSQIVTFNAYPKLGVVPIIDQAALNFLHADIQEACICVGSYVNGQMRSRWLGRNALTKGQFWSSTKIVPILNVVAQANAKSISTQIKDCLIRDPQGKVKNLDFTETAIDIISYRKDDIANDILISNQLSDTLKRFSSLANLETWFETITGNKSLDFRGYYSGKPLIAEPILQTGTTAVLRSQVAGTGGENLVSAYDLTRLVSMLGWHFHIPIEAKLPSAQWHSLETVVRAMGYDSARYVDAAIQLLGLESRISAPVIMSKLGFGPSDLRQRSELCYTALVQLIDDRPKANGQPAKLRTLAMTLRAAVQKLNSSGKRDLDEEARWLDARMAAEVTEILRRIVTEELA